MHTFINSRPMAQMVAFDLMREEQRRAEVRRERRDRRRAERSTRAEEIGSPAPRRRRWHLAKALHLVH
jgi:hypothetical protein